MSLNWKEIDLILSELSLIDGKIQKVLQPEFYSIYLGIYAQRRVQHLCISLEQNAVRINLEAHAQKKPTKAQRFQQLLQSRLIGARIQKIEHIDHDRIILITCQQASLVEDTYLLYIRLWNNKANVILCNKEGQIIDALYRRPKQNIMPKELFSPPHNTKKTERIIEIRKWEEPATGRVSADAETPGAGTPGATGVPNATGSAKTPDATGAPMADAETPGAGTPGATGVPNAMTDAPFNTFIAHHYAQKKQRLKLQDNLAKHWNFIQRKVPHLEKSMAATKKQIEIHSGFEQSKKIGSILLNNMSKIKEGQEWFDFDEDGSKIQIHLNTQISTAQNAENYFKQYKKSQRILQTLEKKLAELTREYEQAVQIQKSLEELASEQKDEDSLSNLSELQKKLHELGKLARPDSVLQKIIQQGGHAQGGNVQRSTEKKSTGLKIVDKKYTYYVGRNAKENDMLLRKIARGNDTWMHVRGKSGAYVFIRSHNKQSIPLANLETAAQLAALFSKCRHNTAVDIHYTQVKHIKKVPKKLGLVTVQQDKNLFVVFNSNMAKELVNREK